MEVVSVDQLPPDLGVQDRGYAVKISAEIYTWNGGWWVPTLLNKSQLPTRPYVGMRYYIEDLEYEFDGDDWLIVAEFKHDETGSPPDGPGEREVITSVPTMALSHLPHYLNDRCPRIKVLQQGSWKPVDRYIECLEIIRWITDGRLFTAMKYIWRVAFGGKGNDRDDIKKAMVYLQDWLDNPVGQEDSK